jgi:hypothetical protein
LAGISDFRKLDLKNSPEETLNSIRLTVPIDWARKSNGDFMITRKITEDRERYLEPVPVGI